MNNTITANYCLEVEDYIEAIQLNILKSKQYPFQLGIAVLYLILLIISICRLQDYNFFFAFKYTEYYSIEQIDNQLYSQITSYSLVLILFYSYVFPKLNPLSRWKILKNYRENFVRGETKEIILTINGISITSLNYREHRQWSNIDHTVENKKLFLLYHSRNQEYIIIPKRIFNSDELNNFRNLLDSNVNQG